MTPPGHERNADAADDCHHRFHTLWRRKQRTRSPSSVPRKFIGSLGEQVMHDEDVFKINWDNGDKPQNILLRADDFGVTLTSSIAEECSASNGTGLRAECVICMDERRTVAIVPCGHVVYCKTCVKRHWLPTECPICRGQLDCLCHTFL